MLYGVEMWLKPVSDNESFNLYSFELIIVTQFIFAWILSWIWNLNINHSNTTIIIVVMSLLILTLIDAYCVFTYDPYSNYPMGMVYRRLYAYQSWFFLTALSIYLQLAIINPTLYNNDNNNNNKTKKQ